MDGDKPESGAGRTGAFADDEWTLPRVCTIGHSNCAIAEFVSLLWSNGIARVLDAVVTRRLRDLALSGLSV